MKIIRKNNLKFESSYPLSFTLAWHKQHLFACQKKMSFFSLHCLAASAVLKKVIFVSEYLNRKISLECFTQHWAWENTNLGPDPNICMPVRNQLCPQIVRTYMPHQMKSNHKKSKAEPIILCVFSSSCHLHPWRQVYLNSAQLQEQLPLTRWDVITILVKDTLPRADVDERHVKFPCAFHAKQLVLFKIILESCLLCTETNEETSQPVWLWEQQHPSAAQPFHSKFLTTLMCVWNLRPCLAQRDYSFKDSG